MKDTLLEIVIAVGGPPAAWICWKSASQPHNNDAKIWAVMILGCSLIFLYLLVRRIISALTKPTRRQVCLQFLEHSVGRPHLRSSRLGARGREH